MRKRPDYGDATPEDLLRSLMTVPRRKARFRQSTRHKARSSQPLAEPPVSSEPLSQGDEDCASQQTPEHSDQDVSD